MSRTGRAMKSSRPYDIKIEILKPNVNESEDLNEMLAGKYGHLLDTSTISFKKTLVPFLELQDIL